MITLTAAQLDPCNDIRPLMPRIKTESNVYTPFRHSKAG